MRTTIEMAREAAGDDWGLFQEYMPEIHKLAELVRADERARMAEQPTTTENNGGKTGWPPGLLQDDCKGLSKWLSNRPDAKRRVREALAEQPAQQEPVEKDNSNYRLDPPGLDPVHQELKTAEAVGYSIGFGAGYQAGKDASPPAQRTWAGLTDEEKRQLFEREDYQGWLDYINAIEAILREKNS